MWHDGYRSPRTLACMSKGGVVTNRLLALLRTAMYALRGGFLVRPLLISITLGRLGAVLSSLEESVPVLSKNPRR